MVKAQKTARVRASHPKCKMSKRKFHVSNSSTASKFHRAAASSGDNNNTPSALENQDIEQGKKKKELKRNQEFPRPTVASFNENLALAARNEHPEIPLSSLSLDLYGRVFMPIFGDFKVLAEKNVRSFFGYKAQELYFVKLPRLRVHSHMESNGPSTHGMKPSILEMPTRAFGDFFLYNYEANGERGLLKGTYRVVSNLDITYAKSRPIGVIAMRPT